MRKSL
jgi:hypothetical protein